VTQDVSEALEQLRREHPGVGEGLIFANPKHPGSAVTRQQVASWLRCAEELAGIEHLPGGGWHAFRRAWASKRKYLSVKDGAYAGGWKDTTTLLKCYQQPDPETVERVILGARQLRMAR